MLVYHRTNAGKNPTPATAESNQEEPLPVGDSGETVAVELYGVNVPIGSDWQDDGDRGTNGQWYASGYSSEAQVFVQETLLDNTPFEECEKVLGDFCDGVFAAYTNPEVKISQDSYTIQEVNCRIGAATNASINNELFNICVLVMPSENKIISLLYAIDAATETEGAQYLESLARQTTYTEGELTAIHNAEQERQEQQAAREALANATYSAGTYKVGQDIPAGEYKLEASGKGYYCVYSDTSKSDILENDNFSSVNYITLEAGQCIELSRCSMVEIAYATPTSTPTGNGMYKIGLGLPAGEYKLAATDDRGY